MAVNIVHAAHDENGRYSAGAAGDQTGKEVATRLWYARPWDFIARPVYQYIAVLIADTAEKLASCPKIGYDQSERTTLYKECEKINWNINRLQEINNCECDCSSLISVILRFAGIEIPETVWTGNLAYYLSKTGYFTLHYEKELTEQENYIRAGDILVNTLHHAAVAVSSGSGATVDTWYRARVNVSDYLQVRTSPGVSADNEFKVGGQSLRLPPGMNVQIVETYGNWCRLYDIGGWVSNKYLISEE